MNSPPGYLAAKVEPQVSQNFAENDLFRRDAFVSSDLLGPGIRCLGVRIPGNMCEFLLNRRVDLRRRAIGIFIQVQMNGLFRGNGQLRKRSGG